MDRKNPLLAGLFNMLVPGSGYWYVDHDRGRFLKTLLAGIAAIVALVVTGTIIQNRAGFPVSQGVCIGILLLFVFVPLFRMGQQAATHYNTILDNAVLHNTRQGGNTESQLAKNQSLREKGLISKQEFNSRKDDISRKK